MSDVGGRDAADVELGASPAGDSEAYSNPLADTGSPLHSGKASFETESDSETESAASRGSMSASRRGMLGGLRSTASTTWADSHVLADMSTGFKKIGRRDASDGNLDPRTDKANETFKRLFKMMDYNRDHSLRDAELKAGLQVLEHAWGAFSELYTCDKADFLKNNLVNEGEQRIYEDMTASLKGKTVEELSADAKSAWRHARGDEVPSADAASTLVDLVLDAEKGKVKKPKNSGSADKDVPSDWLQRALARRKELERMSFPDLKAAAQEAGVVSEEIDEAEGWGKSEEVLKQQILEVNLSQMCRPSDVIDSLLPCGVALSDTLGGKLPSSIDFCEGCRQMLEEDEMAVANARKQLQKEADEVLQQIAHRDDADGETTADNPSSREGQAHAGKRQPKTIIFNAANNDEIHYEHERLLHFLTDPYLLHIVMPQLEAWQMLFNIFDLKRNGYVAFSELQQGLSTACSPEIEIIQTATMVQELLKSMAYVVGEQQLVRRVIKLTVDNDPGFGSRAATQEECAITKLKKKDPTVIKFCKEAMLDEWQGFVAAGKRVAMMCTSRTDLDNLDSAVYGLRYAAHTLILRMNEQLRADDLKMPRDKSEDTSAAPTDTPPQTGAKSSQPAFKAFKDQILQFKRSLSDTVVAECTGVMDAHSFLNRAQYGKRRQTESDIIRKYVSAYLLRRRLKLLARIRQQWATAAGPLPSTMAGGDHHSKKRSRKQLASGKKNAANPQLPLIKLQAKARGAIERRRQEKLQAAALAEPLDAEPESEFVKEEKLRVAATGSSSVDTGSEEFSIRYFDWPLVLIQYLKSRPQIKSLKEAALKVLEMLKAARLKEEKKRDAVGDDEENPFGEGGPPFPEILLNEHVLRIKLETLRNTLHNWNEMLMMLDQNTSGSLNAMELRCSLMAFAQMGLISEMLEYQPMDEGYGPYRDKIYAYPDYHIEHAGKLGWDQDVAKGKSQLDEKAWKKAHKRQAWSGQNKKQREHPYWQNRQDYHVNAKKYRPGQGKKSVLPDYPIYTAQGGVLLMGVEGIPVESHPWAMQLEFQFDEMDPNAYMGAKKYSVLASSYRNNAIVARLSGTLKRPGVQLLFIKKEAFTDASTLLDRCNQFEVEGRPEVNVPLREYTDDADKEQALEEKREQEDAIQKVIGQYPRGEGLYEVTPFVPMEQLRWYLLRRILVYKPKDLNRDWSPRFSTLRDKNSWI